MKNQLLLNKLYENKIEYFSFSLLKNGVPLISHCNNDDWLRFYNEYYNLKQAPPVQKYITSSKLKMIMWDDISVNMDTCSYLKKRNDVVGVGSNATLILKNEANLIAITFGTKYGDSFLLDFLNTKLNLISELF